MTAALSALLDARAPLPTLNGAQATEPSHPGPARFRAPLDAPGWR